MAKPDISQNTDVPATIAGFYFQIVLACREICKYDVEEVGVETGADIVVVFSNKGKEYIETKLQFIINNWNLMKYTILLNIL